MIRISALTTTITNDTISSPNNEPNLSTKFDSFKDTEKKQTGLTQWLMVYSSGSQRAAMKMVLKPKCFEILLTIAE